MNYWVFATIFFAGTTVIAIVHGIRVANIWRTAATQLESDREKAMQIADTWRDISMQFKNLCEQRLEGFDNFREKVKKLTTLQQEHIRHLGAVLRNEEPVHQNDQADPSDVQPTL